MDLIWKLIPCILIFGSCSMGFESVIYFSRYRVNLIESIGLAFPIGFVITSIFGLTINTFIGCNAFHFLVQIVVSFIITFYLRLRNKNKYPANPQISFLSYLGIFFIMLFFSYLSYKSIFPTKDTLISTSKNDMMLEVSLIASFVNGCNKKSSLITFIRIPLTPNKKTTIEIIPAFYCSLLRVGGFTLRLSILSVTILLFSSITLLMFSFVHRIIKNQYISLMSVPTLFLLGGFGFVNFTNNKDRGNGFTDFIFLYGSSETVYWGHPLLHTFLTSRVNLTSLALTLSVLIFLESDIIFIAGIICVIQMFVRPQSGFLLFLIFFTYKNTFLKEKLKFFLIPFVILSFFLLPVIAFMFDSPIWKSTETFIPFIHYLLSIFGFGFIALIFSFRTQNKRKLIIFFGLFYLIGNVSLNKIQRFNFFTVQTVLYPLLIVLICDSINWLINLWKNPEIKGAFVSISVFLFIGMWLSSLAGLYNKLNQTITVFGEEQNHVSKWIIENTKRKSIFASSGNWWNPAVVRAGRMSYNTYDDTLQDFNFDFSIQNNKYNKFMQDPQNKENIEFDYVILSVDESWISKLRQCNLFKSVFKNGKYEIFQYIKE